MAYDVEPSDGADDIVANLLTLHAMADGSDNERSFHRSRVRNATHHVAIEKEGEWVFAPVKWCGAKDNTIEDYPKNKRPVTDYFKPVIIKAGFRPHYSSDERHTELYHAYVEYCARYGFVHSETDDDRTFYVAGAGATRPANRERHVPAVNLSNITAADECYVTRVWGFSPEDWGALGFPKDGTARQLAKEKRKFFVVCFVSHNKAEHISDGDEGLVHGLYELSDEIVDLENDKVLAEVHFANTNNFLNHRFRWRLGLRATRAWRFLSPPMTKASLPVARSKSWDVSTNIVPIDKVDFDLLDQYKLEQVPVFGQPFERLRLTGPVAVPCHVYLFACENMKILCRLPRWKKGEILVKIGCTSDVKGRLASFNDDPLSRIFGFRLAHLTNDLVGEDLARVRETELLEEVSELGRPAAEIPSEFFFIEARKLSSLIARFGRAKKVA